MHSEFGKSGTASACTTRSELLDMVFSGLWPVDGALEALFDRVERPGTAHTRIFPRGETK